MLGWWCSEDKLHAKLSRTHTYSFHFCFFGSLIGVHVSPIPNLEVTGTWFEAGELLTRQGWLGPMGVIDLPGANFDSSPRQVGGTRLRCMPLSLGPTSIFAFYLLAFFSFTLMLRHIFFYCSRSCLYPSILSHSGGVSPRGFGCFAYSQ